MTDEMTTVLVMDFIANIKEAADDAERAGDLERVARLREHMRRLGLSFAGVSAADIPTAKVAPMLDDEVRGRVVDLVGRTGRYELTHIGSAVLIDYGADSTIAVGARGVALTGRSGDDPRVLMFVALHAKEHWNGRMVVRGDDMYRMNAAVANELLGVETVGYSIPDHLLPLANSLRREWQSVRDEIVARAAEPQVPTGSPYSGRRTAVQAAPA